jgi:hypothetical protein
MRPGSSREPAAALRSVLHAPAALLVQSDRHLLRANDGAQTQIGPAVEQEAVTLSGRELVDNASRLAFRWTNPWFKAARTPTRPSPRRRATLSAIRSIPGYRPEAASSSDRKSTWKCLPEDRRDRGPTRSPRNAPDAPATLDNPPNRSADAPSLASSEIRTANLKHKPLGKYGLTRTLTTSVFSRSIPGMTGSFSSRTFRYPNGAGPK